MNFLLNRLERRGPDKRLRERVARYTKDIVAFLREIKPKNNDVKRGKDIL